MDKAKLPFPSHPGVFAQKTPNKPAIIMGGSGQQISFGEFEEISCQIAHMMCQNGLSKGDRVAVLLENHPLYMPIAWGVFRAGLRFVAVATHLTQKEIDYILNDSGAALFITSKAMEKTVLSLKMKNISSEIIDQSILKNKIRTPKNTPACVYNLFPQNSLSLCQTGGTTSSAPKIAICTNL